MRQKNGADFLQLRCMVEGCKKDNPAFSDIDTIAKISTASDIEKLEWSYLGLRWEEENDPILYSMRKQQAACILKELT